MSPILSLFTGSQDLSPAGRKVDQKRGPVTDSLYLLVSTVFQLEGHLWLGFLRFPFWVHLMTLRPLFLVLSNEKVSEVLRRPPPPCSSDLDYKGTCYFLDLFLHLFIAWK